MVEGPFPSAFKNRKRTSGGVPVTAPKPATDLQPTRNRPAPLPTPSRGDTPRSRAHRDATTCAGKLVRDENRKGSKKSAPLPRTRRLDCQPSFRRPARVPPPRITHSRASGSNRHAHDERPRYPGVIPPAGGGACCGTSRARSARGNPRRFVVVSENPNRGPMVDLESTASLRWSVPHCLPIRKPEGVAMTHTTCQTVGHDTMTSAPQFPTQTP